MTQPIIKPEEAPTSAKLPTGGDSVDRPVGPAWIKPTEATPGYYWRMMADGRGEPSIVRVVEWHSGWLDGPDKPWRDAYLAECFGSMSICWQMDELEGRGELLLRLDAPHIPLPNVEVTGEAL